MAPRGRSWALVSPTSSKPLSSAVVTRHSVPYCVATQYGTVCTGNAVSIVDPRHLDVGLMQKPSFAYAPGRAPAPLQELQALCASADAYVAITPEYNHAPSPALLNILNHVGSSTFSFKPSAIVSYSAGQWGGTRAAHALRPILSELGCLPVSAMVHIASAAAVLDHHGAVPADAAERWDGYVDRCLSQLEWWARAACEYRRQVDPNVASPAFRRAPTQRDAP